MVDDSGVYLDFPVQEDENKQMRQLLCEFVHVERPSGDLWNYQKKSCQVGGLIN